MLPRLVGALIIDFGFDRAVHHVGLDVRSAVAPKLVHGRTLSAA
jgi:hypothetical protein